MEKIIRKELYKTVVFFIFCFGIFSCKSSKEIFRDTNLKPIGTGRLLKNLEENSFSYDEMELRISCQFKSTKQNLSLRGTLKAKNNEAILLSFSKMNVPVGKLMITPDSIHFLNYIEKNYFGSNFDHISDLINIDFDFEIINSILSNNVFSYRDDKRNNDFREFISGVESGMYVMRSIKERKYNKVIRKGKDKKVDRLLKKLDEEQLILQTLYIDHNFKLRKVVLDDQFNERRGVINFSNFMEVGKQTYPGEINMQFSSPKENVRLKIKVGKVSFEKDQNFNFKVPMRYKQVMN